MTFIEFSKVVFINMITILIMPTKLVTPDFLEMKVFWNRVYDVITYVSDISNKISSCDLIYIVDMGMWQRGGFREVALLQVQ